MEYQSTPVRSMNDVSRFSSKENFSMNSTDLNETLTMPKFQENMSLLQEPAPVKKLERKQPVAKNRKQFVQAHLVAQVAAVIVQDTELTETPMDDTTSSIGMSKFPLLVASPSTHRSDSKFTSSIIEGDQSRVQSPSVTRIQLNNTNETIIVQETQCVFKADQSTRQLLMANSIDSQQFRSVNPSFFNNDQQSTLASGPSIESPVEKEVIRVGDVLACSAPFQSTVPGDLSMNFSDRVQVCENTGNGQLLVKALHSGAYGYVPTSHVQTLASFFNRLRGTQV